MSVGPIPTFFERDLSGSEADALEEALMADPALAAALLAEAERRYGETGLPPPSWKRRRAPAWRLWALCAAALVAGIYAAREGSQEPVAPVAQLQGELPVVELAERLSGRSKPEPVVREEPEHLPGSRSAKGRRLGVVVNLKGRGEVQVEVRTIKGDTLAVLFHGIQGPGSHRFEWDGKGKGGRPVGAGDYLIVVRQDGREMARPVSLKRGSGAAGEGS